MHVTTLVELHLQVEAAIERAHARLEKLYAQ